MKLNLTGKNKSQICLPHELRKRLGWENDSEITLYHNLNKDRIELKQPAEESNDCYMFYDKKLKEGAFTMPETIREGHEEFFVVMDSRGGVYIVFSDVKTFS